MASLVLEGRAGEARLTTRAFNMTGRSQQRQSLFNLTALFEKALAMKNENPATNTSSVRIAIVIFAGIMASVMYTVIFERDLVTCEDPNAAQERIVACSRVIESNGSNPEVLAAAYNNRGVAHHVQNDYNRAIADYTAAISTGKASALEFYNRGNSFSLAKNPESAIVDFSEAIKRNETYTDAYLQRCAEYVKMDDRQAAIADCSTVLELQPNNQIARKLKATLLVQVGKPEEAIVEIDKFLRGNPRDTTSILVRGILLLERNSKSKAEADFRRVLALEPDNEDAMQMLQSIGAEVHQP